MVCIQNINRPRFIIHATAEYLNRLSLAHSALPNPSALPAARKQWNKFHQYALEVLADVNCNIELQNPTALSMSTVLVRIFSLINAEVWKTPLKVLFTSWYAQNDKLTCRTVVHPWSLLARSHNWLSCLYKNEMEAGHYFENWHDHNLNHVGNDVSAHVFLLRRVILFD